MFARTVVVVCVLGLIAVSDNCRAQSDDDRSKQQLPSSYLYSVLNGQQGDKRLSAIHLVGRKARQLESHQTY